MSGMQGQPDDLLVGVDPGSLMAPELESLSHDAALKDGSRTRVTES